MGNTITAMSPTYWSKRMGHKLYKTDVFRALANFEEQATLHNGQKVDRPYRADIVVENYTKGTPLTAQDLNATSETLTVDVVKAALLFVDNIDRIQNKYSAANLWADEAAIRLSNALDARFLYEAFSASDTIDDGDIGGTDGNGITLSTGNILKLVSAINMKLDANNVPDDERYLAMSPQFFRVLWEYIAGKASMLGDKTGESGNRGEYAGLKLYKTNNLTGSARWTPANDPSNDDTLTVESVTFNFVTSIGSTEGNILTGSGTLATTLTILTAFINAGGVEPSASTSQSLSTANQRKVQEWVAVDGGTYIEVRVRGASYLTVSASETNDLWTNTQQIQNLLAGRKGSIDVVIQKQPSAEMASTVSAGKSGKNILPMTLAGFKTFNVGKSEMFRVQLRSDAY